MSSKDRPQWLDGLKGDIFAGEPMSLHTSLRVGGPADFFIIPEDRQEVVEIIRRCRARGIPCHVIGSGSNLLVRDGGIRGVVMSLKKLNRIATIGPGTIVAEAGVPNGLLVRHAAGMELTGLEFLVGIPGVVGGTVAVNAGAHGSCVCDKLKFLTVCINGVVENKSRRDLHYGYRFLELTDGETILDVVFQLESDQRQAIENRLREYRDHRSSTQQVEYPNAGCWFRNPEGTQAWKLIDAAGMRGARKGGAEVSTAHCNFLVNRGGATARDFIELAAEIRDKVKKQTAVLLQEEVRVVGEP